jgi:hypothetical protein
VKDLIEAKIAIMKWMRAWKGEMTAMCTYEGNDKNISIGTDAYYEEQACQEEIYLEETEEELRMILESDDPSPLRSENPDQQREHAAEQTTVLILRDGVPIGLTIDASAQDVMRSCGS